jgi:pullulanase/glycogen debranching enzyme
MEYSGGTNIGILPASATSMQLVLFEKEEHCVAARTITLDPIRNRIAHYWHIFLPGIVHGQAAATARASLTLCRWTALR